MPDAVDEDDRRRFAELSGQEFDLLVVGGGINGAAIARDAACRGLRVLLVEARDWGWGTSAKSSKLAHGGLRYLELLEFGLVHEALQDRERMFRQAPHLVRPLRFLYPSYPHVAARRSVRLGLMLYDMLSHGKSVPGRDWLKRDAALALAPGLERKGLRGGATFYDGQIQHVERLVMEMVLDARTHGAVVVNHTRLVRFLTRFESAGGGQASRGIHDLSGTDAMRHDEHGEKSHGEQAGSGAVVGAILGGPDGAQIEIRCAAAINATGCWVDETLGPLGNGKTLVRKTKGVHVVVPRFVDTAIIVKAASDGRTFFILPWQDHCILGTTDTDFEGDAGDAKATVGDVAYLVAEAARYFPHAPLGEIAYTYAGVRALVNQTGVTESNVTRRHILHDHAGDGVKGLWSLQGGKITTARSLAEEAVDRVAKHLGNESARNNHPTREARLPGAPDEPWDAYLGAAVDHAQHAWRLERDTAQHLVETYGRRWPEVLACDSRPEALRRIVATEPHLYAQVTHAVRVEQARQLGDVMLRRTTLGLAPHGNPEAAQRVAAWMARLCSWDDARLERELALYAHEASHLDVPVGRAMPNRAPMAPVS